MRPIPPVAAFAAGLPKIAEPFFPVSQHMRDSVFQMKNILLVDNDRIFLKLMARLLEKQGHHVVTAIDGLNALDVLKTYRPDAMFIDLVMPNIDGKMLCRILRGMEKYRDVYLVVLSAVSEEEWVDVAGLGADACIAKGPLEQMTQHVLAVLEQPEETSAQCRAGHILGLQSTEHPRITKELLSANKHFEAILQKMAEGILEINPQQRIVYANPSALAIIDIPKEELFGSQFIDLFPEKERSKIHRLLEENEQAFRKLEIDDSLFLGTSEVTLGFLPAVGDPASTIVILRDIGERKWAERKLKAAREYAQNIIDSSLDMIISVDNNRNIVEFNRAAEMTFGYQKEEVVGKPIHLLYADPDQAESFRNEAIEGENYIGEIQNRRKDGSVFTSLLSVSFMKNRTGEVIGSVGVFRDITESKRTQEELKKHRDHLEESVEERTRALQESEEKYRSILENIQEGYFECDLSGDLTFVNHSLAQITRYAPEELIGMNNREYSTAETAKRMYTIFNRVYDTGEPGEMDDCEILRKDGKRRILELSVNLMRDPENHPIGFSGMVRDVTDRLEAEKERQQLEKQFQQAQKMEAIGTLAGGIAHDFNNLLMGIQGRVSLMSMDTDSLHPYYEHIQGIGTYVKSATELTQQLLGIARGGKFEVRSVDLNRLVREQNQMFGRTRKEIHIHERFQEDLWYVEVDPGQIKQMLLNIYVNAWHAMPGGGDLFVQTENVVIEEKDLPIQQAKPGKYCKISVTDTGVGMDEATRERIFDPFFTTRELGRGTGLGLASVYGVIKNHGGLIEVFSKKGHGATFDIYLPSSDAQVVQAQADSEEVLTGSGTVLLVDDEEIILDVNQQILHHLGYQVLRAQSGKEALEIYQNRSGPIDLVILDMIMAGMGGKETYEKLKQLDPKIKVLLSSGYSKEGDAEEILAQGCNGFIQKPFDVKQLSLKLREVLDE